MEGRYHPRVGDVHREEDGDLFVCMLDSIGKPVWINLSTCSEELQAILITILKTCRVMCTPQSLTESRAVSSTKQRRKTAYNWHISQVLRTLARCHPDMVRADRMRAAVNSWKELVSAGASCDAEKRRASAQCVAELGVKSAYDAMARPVLGRRHSFDCVRHETLTENLTSN